MNKKFNQKTKLRYITSCSILTAVAVILQYIEIAIPLMPSFIKFDFSDLPAIIGAFAYGPLAGCWITILKNIIHMMVSQSAFVGELSNAILGCTICLIAGIFYQRFKSKKGALAAGIVGSIIMALLSYPLNYYLIYPLYFSVLNYPEAVVLQMYQLINPHVETLGQALLIFNLPFTLIKGLVDVAFCMVIYKRLSPFLHGDK